MHRSADEGSANADGLLTISPRPCWLMQNVFFAIPELMTTFSESDRLDHLSDCLLELAQLAKNRPVAEFLSEGASLALKAVGCLSAWWGLAVENKVDKSLDILQADFMGLPKSLVEDWRSISTIDPFAKEMIQALGQVRRIEIAEKRINSQPLLTEFANRYGIEHVMGMCLDEEASGQSFFMVMYRGPGQPSFSDVEAQLFRHLIKHIVQLWYFGLKEELSSRSGNDISRSALARLDGQLLYAGPEIFNFLKSQWEDWDGLTLPEPLLKHFNQLPQSVKLAHGCVSLHLHGDYVLVTDLDESHSTLKLSPREQRVAYLFASGFTYKQISKQLALSPATVRTYLRNAYIRLGVSNKTQLNKFLVSGYEASK